MTTKSLEKRIGALEKENDALINAIHDAYGPLQGGPCKCVKMCDGALCEWRFAEDTLREVLDTFVNLEDVETK